MAPPAPPPTPRPKELKGEVVWVERVVAATVPVITSSPSDRPEVISVSESETRPVSTVTSVTWPFLRTRTAPF